MTLSNLTDRLRKVQDAVLKEPESERIVRAEGAIEDAIYWLQNEKEARMVARANEKQNRKDEQEERA